MATEHCHLCCWEVLNSSVMIMKREYISYICYGVESSHFNFTKIALEKKKLPIFLFFFIYSLFIKLLAHKTMEKNVILEITIGHYLNFKYQ